MADDPNKPPNNWVPSRSVGGGAIFGTAVAQVLVAIYNQYSKTLLGPELTGAVTTICVFTASYFISDKPRS